MRNFLQNEHEMDLVFWQLAPGAKIPKQACAKTYAVKVSQEVIWVWLGDKATADPSKLPWYEHYEREGFQHISTIHELPYDYSILLENLMDPAHIPISHDRTDQSAKRENAQALVRIHHSIDLSPQNLVTLA
jgi:phenylpropionate dioxygenase-like ring-hydroxylating dioxygenase large terminal subunit